MITDIFATTQAQALVARMRQAQEEDDDLTNDACPYCGRLGNGEPCDPFCGAPTQEEKTL